MPRPDPPMAVRRALRESGSHVQAWRKLRGLTQQQLADRAGIDRRTLMRIERGEGSASIDVLLRVIHALGALDAVIEALDPYSTDVGRMRAGEMLPQRVRPRDLGGGDGRS